MPHYHLFGGILRSDLELPELRPAPADSPRWVVSRAVSPRPLDDAQWTGTEDVDAGIRVSLFRSGDALRLIFDDTGIFDISADGRSIEWCPGAEADVVAARKDLLGRVFAAALDQEGITTLHGSAVGIGGTAVAFLAPKFHGKSTTAASLVNAGGTLLADDLVAVTPARAPRVLPSVPVVHLWRDAAGRVAGAAAQVTGAPQSAKVEIAWSGPAATATTSVPLAAIYLLAPFPSSPTRGVLRERLTGVVAALALLGQAKVGALLGVDRRASLLQRMADLADRVPVYRLEVPRDFARIPELTARLLEWHDARDGS
jgi:hypothetical protein